MKYMLDTNTCIFFMKDYSNVLTAFSQKKSDGIVISAVTLSELEYGVCNSSSIDKNRAKLLAFLTLVDILPFGSEAAAEYGKICFALRKQGTPIGVMDMLITAHAKVEKAIAVTNNTKEFQRIDGLAIEDWT